MTSPPTPPPAEPAAHGQATGFPLAAIFLFTAFCCMLAAMAMQPVRAVIASEIPLMDAVVASLLGASLGLVLGSVLGLAQRGALIGMLVGGPTGAVLGSFVGPLCLLNTSRLSPIVGISIGGGALLIVGAVVVRMIGARSSSTESSSPDET